MPSKYYDDIVDLFIKNIFDRYGNFYPGQLEETVLKQEIATFSHEIERILIDRYELDE